MAIVETPPCKWTPPVCNDREYPKRPIREERREKSQKTGNYINCLGLV